MLIQKMRIVYEGLLLRLLFLLMACSSNESSDKTSTATPVNTENKLSTAIVNRRDSLLATSNQWLYTLDSLQKAGINGIDSLEMNTKEYKNLVTAWYESELADDIKMCVDVKRIFLITDELRSKHLENYLDLTSRMNSKLVQKDSLRFQYQGQLSRDVIHFLQPLNDQLTSFSSSSIKEKNIFCPEVYSKEKEKELKGKEGKEQEIKLVLAQFQANPIVQTYTSFKRAQKGLVEDLTGLNRRYHLFF
jgi:hypothetical protein